MRRKNLVAVSAIVAVVIVGAAVGGVSASRDDGARKKPAKGQKGDKGGKGHKGDKGGKGKPSKLPPKPAPSGDKGASWKGPKDTEPATDRDNTGVETVNADWKPRKALLEADGTTKSKCAGHFSGSADAAGNVFFVCGSTVNVRGRGAVLVEAGQLRDSAPDAGARDLAVTPDGRTIYFSRGTLRKSETPSKTDAARGFGGLGKATRKMQNGKPTWVVDTTFESKVLAANLGTKDSPNLWGHRYNTVAPNGLIYTSVNAYVYAYDSNGNVRADYAGQYSGPKTVDANGNPTNKVGPAIGGYPNGVVKAFGVVHGVAFNPSGRNLFVADKDTQIIARFTADANGAYVVDKYIGTYTDPGVVDDPSKDPTACRGANFYAPTDVDASAARIFVADTTCGRIRRFTFDLVEENPAPLTVTNCDRCFRPHGVTVSNNGAMYLPYRNAFYGKSGNSD